MKKYNFIIIMSTGYVHQVRIEGKDWQTIKGKEMKLIKAMMDIDFWSQINHTMLLEIKHGTPEPTFSIEYNTFLHEILNLR